MSKYKDELILQIPINNHKQETFTFKIATTQKDLDELFRLRYRVYCEEYGYLDYSKYPDQKEVDEWDKFSTHFVGLNSDSHVVITARLIRYSPIGLRVEDYADISFLPKNQTREISRLTLSKELRGTLKGSKLILWICKLIYDYSLRNNIKYWVGTMFIPTWKLFLHQGIYFTLIGEQSEWPKGSGIPVFPVILDLEKAKIYLKYKNPKVYEFFAGDSPSMLSRDKEAIQEILLKIQNDLAHVSNITTRRKRSI